MFTGIGQGRAITFFGRQCTPHIHSLTRPSSSPSLSVVVSIFQSHNTVPVCYFLGSKSGTNFPFCCSTKNLAASSNFSR